MKLSDACVACGTPNADRCFPITPKVEKAYFRKTGTFPIMHCIGSGPALAEKHPWLATSVYTAFLQTKEHGMKKLRAIDL